METLRKVGSGLNGANLREKYKLNAVIPGQQCAKAGMTAPQKTLSQR